MTSGRVGDGRVTALILNFRTELLEHWVFCALEIVGGATDTAVSFVSRTVYPGTGPAVPIG